VIEFFRTRLGSLPDTSLRLALAFTAMPKRATVSRRDLAARAGIAPTLLDRALRDAEADRLLVLKTRSGVDVVMVTSEIDGDERNIQLLPDPPLEAELDALRAERTTLVGRLRRADDESTLADDIPLEEAAVVRLAESLLGRKLDLNEAYRLGQLIQGYGPNRVKGALEIKRKSKQPLRAAYAFLANGARGPAAAQKPAPRPVVYFTPSEDYSPY